jgi:hypothetical protein
MAWIWTLTYSLGLVFFAIRSVSIIAGGGFPDVVDTFFTVALLIIVVMAYLRSVKAYAIEGGNLVIVRSGPGRINISLDDIIGAVAVPAIGSFFNISVLSTGGVFGWSGKARVRNPSDLKSIDADVYGTNPKYSVMLELRSKRKVIITPAEPKEMETALRVAGAGEYVSDNRPRLSSAVADRGDKPKPWLQGNKK